MLKQFKAFWLCQLINFKYLSLYIIYKISNTRVEFFCDLTGSIGRNAITFRRVTVREADRHSRVNLWENVSPVLEVNLLSILPVADVGKRGVHPGKTLLLEGL